MVNNTLALLLVLALVLYVYVAPLIDQLAGFPRVRSKSVIEGICKNILA